MQRFFFFKEMFLLFEILKGLKLVVTSKSGIVASLT